MILDYEMFRLSLTFLNSDDFTLISSQWPSKKVSFFKLEKVLKTDYSKGHI